MSTRHVKSTVKDYLYNMRSKNL
ncbi:MAG: hypothetical protein UV41_C0047G0008, partial [Candidatus Daviesbacteria bacterium GW2011_GWA2_42_7]